MAYYDTPTSKSIKLTMKLSISLHAFSDALGHYRLGFDAMSRCVWSVYAPDEYQVDDNSRRLLTDVAATLETEIRDILNTETATASSPSGLTLQASVRGDAAPEWIDETIAPAVFRRIGERIDALLRDGIAQQILDIIG